MKRPLTEAEARYLEYLLAHRRGQVAGFATYCRAHPDLTEEMERARTRLSPLLGARGRSRDEPSLARQLAFTWGAGIDPCIRLTAAADSRTGEPADASPSPQAVEWSEEAVAPYVVEEVLAAEGDTLRLRAWDRDLHRPVVVKTLRTLPRGDDRAGGERPPTDLLREALVISSLEHPGVAPVHELGVDACGRPYFTISLVEGRPLAELLASASPRRTVWTSDRIVGVLAEVCDILAHAHSRGVAHGDLHTGQVTVGSRGDVTVRGWGRARLSERSDTGKLQLRVRGELDLEAAWTGLAQGWDPEGGASDFPADARSSESTGSGQLADETDYRADVRAVGTMLHALLAGDEAPSREQRRPAGARRDGPPELTAIRDAALADDPGAGYADPIDLARELRAYLDGRVVRAYETGALAELRKWVVRNTRTAVTLATCLVAVLGGLTWVSASETSLTRDLMTLADAKRLEQLKTEAQALRYPRPENVDPMRAWCGQAEELLAGLAGHRARLDQLRLRGRKELPLKARRELDAWVARYDGEWWIDALQHRVDQEIDRKEEGDGEALLVLSSTLDLVRSAVRQELAVRSDAARWTFDEPRDRWWHDALADLVEGLQELAGSEPGTALLAEMRTGLDFLSRGAQSSVASAWPATLAGRNDYEPPSQLGLHSLGRDPHSGLFEFAHRLSGQPAKRDPTTGELLLTEDTGLVLVLLPGGTFWMGAQQDDPAAPNFDPCAQPCEGPVHPVVVAPFLLSKYELTQGQWRRCQANPSFFRPSRESPLERGASFLYPVEQVKWTECRDVLQRLGLALPTEAQWEYAARAGSGWPWWTGAGPGAVATAELLAIPGVHADALMPRAVGAGRPNPFGLHDTLGNVAEWCQEVYQRSAYLLPIASGDGLPSLPEAAQRVVRGGSYLSDPPRARVAQRRGERLKSASIGIRPAMVLRR